MMPHHRSCMVCWVWEQGNDFKKDGLQRMQEQQREGTVGPPSAETNIHRRDKCGKEAILRANGECG